MNEPDEKSTADAEEGARLLQAYQDAQQKGDVAAQEAAMLHFVDFAQQQTEKEPSQDLLLKTEAQHHEATGKWREAETAYRQCLVLAQEENNPAMVFKAHLDLSRLYGFLNHKQEALQSARAAEEAARLSDMTSLLGMALENEAFCFLHQKNAVQALQIADQLVQMLPTEKIYDTQKARALVLRARCHAELHHVVQANHDLRAALPLLAPLSRSALFVGVQSGLAHWWEVTAQLNALQSDFDGASAAWRKAVYYRRVVVEAPQMQGPYIYAALARSLRGLGQALLAVGDTAGSEEALQECKTIQAAIHQPVG